jgi:hypothetical protein
MTGAEAANAHYYRSQDAVELFKRPKRRSALLQAIKEHNAEFLGELA